MEKNENTTAKLRVAIHVHDMMVQTVYVTDPSIEVEVLDTDEPGYLMPEEAESLEQVKARLDEISKSPDWIAVY